MAFSFLKDYDDPDVKNCTTYTEVIKNRVRSIPNKIAFRFLSDGENVSDTLTYAQLEMRSKAIGSVLQKNGRKGDTVLMLFQTGLSYVASLFACFYSGFVAIPAYPPRRNRGIDRIYSIIEDSECSICLTTKSVYKDIKRNFDNDPLLSKLNWIIYEDVNDLASNEFGEIELSSDDIALLQYTSGSTGNPKGVIISQMNLLYNSESIRNFFNHDMNLIGVHWLPIFHDMGLVGSILQPPYVGGESNLMPPVVFLKNPFLWLKAIGDYKATTIGGPNFMYDYCVNKIADDKIDQIDLSSIKIAYCGSEPIREATYNDFFEKFKDTGFKKKMYYSCFGMAETTLIVTGGHYDDPPRVLYADPKQFANSKIVEVNNTNKSSISFVSCGSTLFDTQLVIVDPQTLEICHEDVIGEVWISGPTVAVGYWNNEEETERNFNAFISETGEGPFFRTGDLGFLNNNELFITGRIKDLIIIRGKNHYPGDIEFSIQDIIVELKFNSGAVFSIADNGTEKLVVVQELERSAMRDTDFLALFSNIRKIISEDHELEIHEIILLRPGSIPMTSSGKIQRRQTKFDYLNGNLNIIESWQNDDLILEEYITIDSIPTEESIKEWVIQWLMRNQRYRRQDIDPDKNLMSYGIDSLAAVTLETEISKQFGFQWHVSSFILNPTINKLAEEGMEIFNGEE